MNRKRISRLLNLILKDFKRDYIVLSPSDRIEIGRETYTVEELALRYQPTIYQSADLAGPTPFASKYEVIPRNRDAILVYQMFWQDEIHPDPLIHLLYKCFRIFFYGSSLDIETVELLVDGETGGIMKIIFETESSEAVEPFVPSHERSEINLLSNGKYANKISGEDLQIANPFFDGQHIELETLTWNHEFRLRKEKDVTTYRPQLSFLTDNEYMKQRFTRRRLHAYITKKEFLIGILISFVSTILLFCSSLAKAILNGLRPTRAH